MLGELDEGVYDTLQEPEETVHEEALNAPPAPPSLHDTEPVGMEVEFEVSKTLAVRDMVDTDVTDVGFALTDSDVVSDGIVTAVELLCVRSTVTVFPRDAIA